MSKKSGKCRPQQKRRPTPPVQQPPGDRRSPTPAEQTPKQSASNAGLILLAGFGAALLLFWYYHLLVLNQMTDLSAGLAMPGPARRRLRHRPRGGPPCGHGCGRGGPAELRAQDSRRAVHAVPGGRDAAGDHPERAAPGPALGAVRGAAGLRRGPALGPGGHRCAARPLRRPGSAVDAGAVALASGLTVAGWVLLFATVAVAAVVLLASFNRTPG